MKKKIGKAHSGSVNWWKTCAPKRPVQCPELRQRAVGEKENKKTGKKGKFCRLKSHQNKVQSKKEKWLCTKQYPVKKNMILM